MTPRARRSGGIRDTAVYAPRTLKAPIGWRCSHFRATGAPTRSETAGALSSGVRTAIPWSPLAAALNASSETTSTRLLATEAIDNDNLLHRCRRRDLITTGSFLCTPFVFLDHPRHIYHGVAGIEIHHLDPLRVPADDP